MTLPPPLLAVWRYRGFVLGSVAREFQLRYRHSMLGALWALLGPVATIAVYALVFSHIMQARLPNVASPFGYTVYLCAGVFAWNLFAEVVQRGHTVFIEHGQLIRKMSFPRLCLPVVVVLNALVNFAAVFVVLLGFLLVVGAWPGWPLLGLVVPLALMATIGIALGMTLGVLNVFFRDVGPAVGIGLQFWFWLTPIVYPLQALPTGLAAGLQVNPLLPLVAACQRVLVEGRWPDWSSLWAPALLAVLLCALAWRVFRRHAADMADVL